MWISYLHTTNGEQKIQSVVDTYIYYHIQPPKRGVSRQSEQKCDSKKPEEKGGQERGRVKSGLCRFEAASVLCCGLPAQAQQQQQKYQEKEETTRRRLLA